MSAGSRNSGAVICDCEDDKSGVSRNIDSLSRAEDEVVAAVGAGQQCELSGGRYFQLNPDLNGSAY